MEIELPVSIRRQPDYTTCGPTSLHAVYSYWNDPVTLDEVIAEVTKLEGGGTLGVHLAVHALRRGYQADIWVCNVAHFDPTWFHDRTDVAAKLRARAEAKGLLANPRYAGMVEGVAEFTARGGTYHWGDLTPRRLGGVLKQGLPVVAGVNGTYLYQCAREKDDKQDDVGGEPFGHFLVLCGYHSAGRTVSIADPLKDNPLHGGKYYRVGVYRLLGALFLGASSDDANLLVIRPRGKAAR